MLAKTALTAGAVVVAGVCVWFGCNAVDDLSGDGAGGAKKRRASAAPAGARRASAAPAGARVLGGERTRTALQQLGGSSAVLVEQRVVQVSDIFTLYIHSQEETNGYAKCSRTQLSTGAWLPSVANAFLYELKRHSILRATRSPSLLVKLVEVCDRDSDAAKVLAVCAQVGLRQLAVDMASAFLALGSPVVSASMSASVVARSKKPLEIIASELERLETQTDAGTTTTLVAAVLASWEQHEPLSHEVLHELEQSSYSWFEVPESRRNLVAVGIVLQFADDLEPERLMTLLDRAVRTLRSTSGSVEQGSRLRVQDILAELLSKTEVQPMPAMRSHERAEERAEELCALITTSEQIPMTVEVGLGVDGVLAVRECFKLSGGMPPHQFVTDLCSQIEPEHIRNCADRNRHSNLCGRMLEAIGKDELGADARQLLEFLQAGNPIQEIDPGVVHGIFRTSISPDRGARSWCRAAVETLAATGQTHASALQKMLLTFTISPRCLPWPLRVGMTALASDACFHIAKLDYRLPAFTVVAVTDYSRLASGTGYSDPTGEPSTGVVAALSTRYSGIICTQLATQGFVISGIAEGWSPLAPPTDVDDAAVRMLQLLADVEYLAVQWEAKQTSAAMMNVFDPVFSLQPALLAALQRSAILSSPLTLPLPQPTIPRSWTVLIIWIRFSPPGWLRILIEALQYKQIAAFASAKLGVDVSQTGPAVRTIVANGITLASVGDDLLNQIPPGALVLARDPSRLTADMVPAHASILYASGAAASGTTTAGRFDSQHHRTRRYLFGDHCNFKAAPS